MGENNDEIEYVCVWSTLDFIHVSYATCVCVCVCMHLITIVCESDRDSLWSVAELIWIMLQYNENAIGWAQ